MIDGASQRDLRDQSTYSRSSSAASLSLLHGDVVSGPGAQVCPGPAGSLYSGSGLQGQGRTKAVPLPTALCPSHFTEPDQTRGLKFMVVVFFLHPFHF